MKFSTNICILFWHIFLLLFFSFSSINACPFQVQQFCACVDQLDGVLLNCSAPNLPAQNAQKNAAEINRNNLTAAEHLMQILKTNQAHLGLIKLLAIHNSPIGELSENLFAGLYIRRLELVNCEIRKMAKGAFKGLEGVLQQLIMTGNLIEEMPTDALQQMNSLTLLDLSNNAIGELKAEYALPRLPKLSDINLSHNSITGMHKTFFENVKNNIQTINLGHNLMGEVPASALRGFRMLMAMHLHNNRFTALPQLSFMNLPMLSLLNLASNRIGPIHRQAFLNAPQLRFLYLSGNRINEVQPFQFSSFEHLEMLDLSNNLLESLPKDSFAGLPALRQLYLGENKISQIQPHAFSANSSIAVLILEQNHLTELGKDSFQNLRQVQQISLKNNKLRSIDAGAFQGNPGLVMLDLSHNELIDLAPATFLSQLNLLLVDLSYNRIIRTPFGAFGRRVATVLLQENPLVCVERIHMLQQGNGVFIPNNEDKICGPTEITTTVEPTNQRRQQKAGNQEFPAEPSAAPERETSADFDTEDGQDSAEPPSAFVQQQTSLPTAGFSLSNLPNGQNFAPNRLGNIKPIRITPATQMPSEKRSRGETPISSSSESTEPIPMSESIAGSGENSASNPNAGGDEIVQITTARLEEIEEATTALTTMDAAEARFNPNVIYPHPVPFLKPAPKMHVATHVESDENGNPILTATLPSSILIAENLPPPESDQSKQAPDMAVEGGNSDNEIEPSGQKLHRNNSATDFQKFEEFALQKPIEPEIVHQRVEEEIDNGNGGNEAAVKPGNGGKSMLPTAIIVICMGTVAVVMCAVFVGLCVARKRQLRQMSDVGINLTTAGLNGTGPHCGSHYANGNSAQHSPNSNSYMTAAAAARAAQMSAFYPKHFHEQQQGTIGIRRSASGTLSNRLPATPDDIYGWLYTPNGYNAYKK